MRLTKHRATVIFRAITTCIIIVAAALIQTNAPTRAASTSSPVRFAALEIHKKSIRPKATLFRLAQTACGSQDGLKSCGTCAFYQVCCSYAHTCICYTFNDDYDPC
jgi:hypothetical protein